MSTSEAQIITIIGQRRSGLHAVVNWLIGLHPHRVRYINDPLDDLPLKPENIEVCYDYDVSPEAIRLRPTQELLKLKIKQLNRQTGASLPWPWNGIARRIIQRYWEPLLKNESINMPTADGADDLAPKTHIVLFENISPERAAKVLPAWLFSYRQLQGLPPSKKEHLFIVARSPWNCLASTIKRPMSCPPNPVPPENVGALWTSYAKEIAGETNLFKSSFWNIQPLIYDEWIGQPDLRATIAQMLGCTPNDLGISSTARHGNGSSFANQKNRPSSKNELTNRWVHFKDHRLMKALLSSPDVIRLASKLGLPPPKV